MANVSLIVALERKLLTERTTGWMSFPADRFEPMKFPKDTPVTEKKLNQLLARIERLGIDLTKVDEGFIRSPGPGGQKVNKTSSSVMLRYPDPELVVKWSTERSRAMNRFFALRELVDRIEALVSPETSKRLAEQEKSIERKRQRKRRAKKKHAARTENAE